MWGTGSETRCGVTHLCLDSPTHTDPWQEDKTHPALSYLFHRRLNGGEHFFVQASSVGMKQPSRICSPRPKNNGLQ